MARRIIRYRGPEDIQQLRFEASDVLKLAVKKAADIGRSAGSVREATEKAEVRLRELDELHNKKMEELGVVKSEVEEKILQLKKFEGDVTAALAKCAEVELRTQKVMSDHTRKIKLVKVEQQNVLEAQRKKCAQVGLEVETLQLVSSALEGDIAHANITVAQLRSEEGRLKDILQQIPKAERELEELSNKKVDAELMVLEFEKRYSEMVSKYNSEKARYEEVFALRNGEEKELERRRKQLIEKEEEVETKVRSLRKIQAGVDLETARLHRREQELELKLHLANKQSEVTDI